VQNVLNVKLPSEGTTRRFSGVLVNEPLPLLANRPRPEGRNRGIQFTGAQAGTAIFRFRQCAQHLLDRAEVQVGWGAFENARDGGEGSARRLPEAELSTSIGRPKYVTIGVDPKRATIRLRHPGEYASSADLIESQR
jgi:hypothetical protein